MTFERNPGNIDQLFRPHTYQEDWEKTPINPVRKNFQAVPDSRQMERNRPRKRQWSKYGKWFVLMAVCLSNLEACVAQAPNLGVEHRPSPQALSAGTATPDGTATPQAFPTIFSDAMPTTTPVRSTPTMPTLQPLATIQPESPTAPSFSPQENAGKVRLEACYSEIKEAIANGNKAEFNKTVNDWVNLAIAENDYSLMEVLTNYSLDKKSRESLQNELYKGREAGLRPDAPPLTQQELYFLDDIKNSYNLEIHPETLGTANDSVAAVLLNTSPVFGQEASEEELLKWLLNPAFVATILRHETNGGVTLGSRSVPDTYRAQIEAIVNFGASTNPELPQLPINWIPVSQTNDISPAQINLRYGAPLIILQRFQNMGKPWNLLSLQDSALAIQIFFFDFLHGSRANYDLPSMNAAQLKAFIERYNSKAAAYMTLLSDVYRDYGIQFPDWQKDLRQRYTQSSSNRHKSYNAIQYAR